MPVAYKNNFTADTRRGPSLNIWGNFPWWEIERGIKGGVLFKDDFDTSGFTVPTTEGQIGPWYKAFTSTGGTIKAATPVRGGVVTLGSDGDDEGASIATVGCPFQIVAADGMFCMETRIKVSSIAVTLCDVFVGLCELVTLTATVPITATAGAMADKNFVGFMRPGTSTAGDGSIVRTTYKADGITAVTVADYASQFVADTFIKLGMKFDPKDNILRFFINGVEQATTKTIPASAGTDFPSDTLMGPMFAVLNTAVNTSLITMDWWRFGQVDATP